MITTSTVVLMIGSDASTGTHFPTRSHLPRLSSRADTLMEPRSHLPSKISHIPSTRSHFPQHSWRMHLSIGGRRMDQWPVNQFSSHLPSQPSMSNLLQPSPTFFSNLLQPSLHHLPAHPSIIHHLVRPAHALGLWSCPRHRRAAATCQVRG